MSDDEKRPLYRWNKESDELVEVQFPDPPQPAPTLLPESAYPLVRNFHAQIIDLGDGAYVWSYRDYLDDFGQEWDSEGPNPTCGTYATKRAAQLGYLKATIKEAGILTPTATRILIDLIEELSDGR